MAKKFTYRLETLLQLRSHKVTQAKESLAGVLRLRFNKDEAIDNKNTYKVSMLANEYKSSKAEDLQARMYHKQFVEKELDILDRERKQLLEIEALRRNKLNIAMQNEKVLTKLKDKKIEQYKYDLNIEENNMIDEIAISRYRNNTGLND